MRIRAIRTFDDVKCGTTRAPGDVWEADAARLAEINSAGWGDLAEQAEPEPDPEPAKPARKARRK